MTPPPNGLSDQGLAAWELLHGPPVARRGLWTPQGPPEDSLAAIEAAIAAGYGVEVDVRLSADGQAVVFHDEGLLRMTGESGRVQDRTAAELSALRLRGGSEGIPTLAEVLELVAGRALVLLEMKDGPGPPAQLAARVAEALARYDGPAAAIGFGGQSHAWLADSHAGVLRGLNFDISDPYAGTAAKAQPHFLLPALEVLRMPTTTALRGSAPFVCWNVRTPEQRDAAQGLADNIIFDGFLP